MAENRKFKQAFILPVALAGLALSAVIFYFTSSTERAEAEIVLKPNNLSVIKLGKSVYARNCASCHGAALEGAANWKQRDPDGYMPAPPHDETGHTWHHPDSYLFLMTKYGIEQLIGEKYPNNMPAYEEILSNDEIVAVLSYIKSTWPDHIQRQHDQINTRANAQ